MRRFFRITPSISPATQPPLPAVAVALAAVGPVHAVHQVGDLSRQVGGQGGVARCSGGSTRQQQRRRRAGAPRCDVRQEAAQQRLDAALLRPQRQGAAEEAVEAARKRLRLRLRGSTQLGGPR